MELYGKSLLVSQESSNEYSLRIMPDNGRKIGSLTKDAFFKTIEGVNYYEYTNKRQGIPPDQLYCICGYKGKPEVIRKKYRGYGMDDILVVNEEAALEKRYMYHNENNEVQYIHANEVVKVETDVGCPVCKKEPDISLFCQKEKKVLHNYRIATPINQTKKVFEWEVIHYKVDKHNKCKAIKSKSCLEVDLQTGESIIRTEGEGVKELNVSVEIQEYHLRRAGIWCIGKSAEASYLLKEFLQECLVRRGVRHKSLDEIVFCKKGEQDWQREVFGIRGVMNVMPFLRYPQLETMDGLVWTDMPKNIQKRMEHAVHSKISVIEALTGHKSKSIRLLVEKEGKLALAILFGRFIQDPNHLKKLLTGHMMETESPFDLWEKKKYVSFFRQLYPTEKQFVNGLLNLHKSLSAFDDQDGFLREQSFDFFRISGFLEDAVRMFEEIKGRNSSYQLPFQGDLKKLHDDLVQYYNKMHHENKVIPYREEERSLYHRTVGNYQFVLAKDTHELLDAGEEMDHCVGSYREQALSGESIIVFAFNEQRERRLCLELKGKEKKQLMQVKRHGNQLPGAEEAAVVKMWCELCGVETNNASDLKALTASSYSL